jgi:hypothetical protein
VRVALGSMRPTVAERGGAVDNRVYRLAHTSRPTSGPELHRKDRSSGAYISA